MIYKQFQDLRLSGLGLGMMRLPVLNGDDGAVDEAAAAEMIDYAYRSGINYFDTAWGYHNGNSELTAGKYLSRYPRESYFLATKFPGYDLSNMDKVEEIFEKQLEKCRVDHFDFYLVHNVCEMNIDEYLDERHGIYAYLKKQKENGRIKHFGFSAHGDYNVIERFLEVYGADMEFCQLQINYLDWSFQSAREKAELIRSRNIPVWVMEPLRGGKLASLDEKYVKKLKALRPDETAVAWAFRFLQSIPSVTVTLSGMSDFEQVKQNIATYEQDRPLDEKETQALFDIAADMVGQSSLPCTACKYCTSHCPQKLDIPELIKIYNEHRFTGGGFLAPMLISTLDEGKRPSACIGCRSCEKVCPQQIKISEMMKDFSERLENQA